MTTDLAAHGYKSVSDCRGAVNAMARIVREIEHSGLMLSYKVAEWFDRGGQDILQEHLEKNFKPVEDKPWIRPSAVAVLAGALHMTTQSVYRLRGIGTVRRILGGDAPDKLSDRTIAALVPMLADCPDEIPRVFDQAWKKAAADGTKLTTNLLKQSLQATVPSDSPALLRGPSDQEVLIDLLQRAYKHVSKSGGPARLLAALQGLEALAEEWSMG